MEYVFSNVFSLFSHDIDQEIQEIDSHRGMGSGQRTETMFSNPELETQPVWRADFHRFSNFQNETLMWLAWIGIGGHKWDNLYNWFLPYETLAALDM